MAKRIDTKAMDNALINNYSEKLEKCRNALSECR